jgi:hypothetical protein
MTLEVCFRNLDPHLNVGVISTKLISLGASVFGA